METQNIQMIVAPRTDQTTAEPQDWQQLASLPGTRVVGNTQERIQISFTAAALTEAKQRFGQSLLFEELSPISFAD
jgi:hypothetical protein